jgi:hypothetical protein
MAWEKQNKQGGNFLKFEEGKVIEGIYKGCKERPSPFEAGKILTDYELDLQGVTKILSSGSMTLKEILPITPVDTVVRIEMRLFKGRKVYDVYFNK